MYDAAGGATAAAVAHKTDAPPAMAEARAPDHAATDPSNHASANSGPEHAQASVADVGPFGSKGEAQLAASARSDVAAPITEIVFVDGRLPDLPQLAPRPGVEVVVLDPTKDGISQVSEALAGHDHLAAVHFVGHGESGEFTLGATRIDAATLATRAGDIAGWSSALGQNADIMIWGCDVADQPAGQALMSGLASLTGADVAASTDLTGSAQRDGDWALEASTGSIETAAPFEASSLAAWDHLLDPPAITKSGGDTLNVAEPSALNAAGADRASLAAWQFESTAGGNVTVTAVLGDASIGSLSSTAGGSAVAGGWTFTGTLAEANAWLDGLVFTAADVERGTGSGKTAISLTITDADGGSASKSIAVEVTPSNDPTTIADQTANVSEGGTIAIGASVLAPMDPELAQGAQIASQIVYRVTDDPDFGYLMLSGQRIGVNSIFTQQDVIDGKLVYVHTATGADQNTADGFSVLVNDGATPQANSDSARITLNVTPVNQAPTVSGSGAVYEGQPANATAGGVPQSIVGSFITADGGGDPGDAALHVQLTALPGNGALFFTGTAVVGGVSQTFTNHQITAADIAAGFIFDYAARDGLTYANDGVDGPGGRPPNDSFGVKIIDGGGGSGTPASTDGTIQLTIRPVNDDPLWVEGSTRTATVPQPTGDTATDYKVTLTTAMLNVTDVDSPDQNITFVVNSTSGLDQGRLVFTDTSGNSSFIPQGGTFTLADVKAGRVQYWQLSGAAPGQTDQFTFQVVDNATAPHWDADGTQFERLGGVYTNLTSSGTLRNFDFTIDLADTPNGTGGGLPDLNPVVGQATSTYAGTNPNNGATLGELTEGGTVTLTNGSGNQPGLNYTVQGVDPSQIVYTILGFDGAGAQWNGQLQKLVDSAWVDLGLYDTFTQADLNAELVRFRHDGGEDFESSVRLQASAGILVSDGQGGLTADKWDTSFSFYITPVNDAPVAVGSSDTVINEGDTVAITTDFLNFSDADDAQSENYLEGTATLPGGGGNNYAVNHDESNPLTFTVTSLPQHGKLQYRDGSGVWQDVTAGMSIDTSWITGDAATTRLRYVHDGGEDRADGFVVQATDRWGATSNVANVDFAITNVNDPPQIAQNPTATDPTGILPGTTTPGTGVNEPLTIVGEGSFAQITAAMLQAIDPDSSADQVQYRITSAPAHGRIAYSVDGVNFVTIGVGSAFTQADVTAGRIYYLSNGDEPSGRTYPAAPDDTFVFTLADGAAEQAGREFWIYTKPVNDAPVVQAPSGPVDVTDTSTDVPGFSVSDPDLTSIISGAETDFLQVVVRLTHEDGTAFSAADYAALGGVEIDVAASGATTDGNHDGSNDYLVLRGTRTEINTALAGLKVAFNGDRDEVYQVEVIADDRLRDASGNLIDQDPAAGVQPWANGGTQNQSETVSTGSPEAISGQDNFDWYADAVPTTGALVGNIAAASVTLRASTVNDPATLTSGSGEATVNEDQATFIGDQINFTITDPESQAFDTPVTVTLTIPSGTLDVGSDTGAVTVAGAGTGTLVLTGTAADVQQLLNEHLTYKSAANVNDDLNGAAAGDVTLTVSFDDTGSNIGSGEAANNPTNIEIGVTITPVNDAPTVSAGSGTVIMDGPTPVPGFSVGDIDLSGDGAAAPANGETDFVQVTVRITDEAGNPLVQGLYADVTISSASAPAQDGTFRVDGTYDGTGSALVIRGTREQVNDYLAGLQVQFDGSLANSDQHYRVEVIADDRVRDIDTGALAGNDANGGMNDNGGSGTTPVPAAAIDPYQAVPGDLDANVAVNSRDVFPTGANDPAHIDVSGANHSPEGSTVQLGGIQVSDSDALSDTLTATVTLPSGFTISSVNGSTSDNPGQVTGIGTGTVTITGSLDEINAALNSIIIKLPDPNGVPTETDWNGQFDVTITVNDDGYNGGRPGSLLGDSNDPGSNPGDFDYADETSAALITTRTFTVTVDPVNDAPVVAGDGSEVLETTPEDTANPTGRTVSELFGGQFGDPVDAIDGGSSSNAFAGVAVTGLTLNPAQGAWQYFNGTTWVNIGARSASNALVLGADTLVRFLPAADFHGTPNTMTVVLVDDSDGGDGSAVPAAGDQVNLNGAGATGGTTRYSAGTVTLSTAVSNVNDRPTVADGVLPSGTEDVTTSAGSTVGDLFGSGYSDATDNKSAITGGGNAATAFGGIAIVGNASTAAQGSWEYSLDNGDTWNAISGSVSDTAALLLPTDAKLRFVPAGNFNGDPGGLTIRAADTAVNFADGADISGTVGNQTSTWSVTHSLITAINPLNDAPVLGGTATNPTASESGTSGIGTDTVNLVNTGTVALSDLDLTTTPGLNSQVFGAGRVTVNLTNYQAGDVLSVQGGLPAGVTVSAGTDGTLTITLDADTTLAEVQGLIERITYHSTSDDPTSGGTATTRGYSIVVNDGNNLQGGGNAGGPALPSNAITGTITINAANDPPAAVDDINSVTEDTPSATGNVIAGGVGGAGRDTDPDSSNLVVIGVTFESNGQGVGTRFATEHGWLTLSADGTYTYELDNTDPAVNALKTGDTLQEVVGYTISDGTGGTATATLTITIQGRTDGPPTVAPVDGNSSATGEAEVHEHGLTDPSDTTETTTGSIAVTAADGLASITVGGRTVTLAELNGLSTTPVTIDTGEGTLTLTGFTPGTTVGGVPTAGTLTYSYELKTTQGQPGAIDSTDPIALTVTDAGGGTSNGTLTVRIVDDVPVATNDAAEITEDQSPTVNGNVVGSGGSLDVADSLGADGAAAGGAVTGVSFDGNTQALGTGFDTAYGHLTLNADGSYSYVLDNSNAAVNALKTGGTLQEVVTYTITDGDGDTSTATLTITVRGNTDSPPTVVPVDGNGSATGEAEVHEHGLTDPSDGSQTTTGSIAVTAADGLQSITVGGTTVTLAELNGLSTTPVVIDTGEGTLTLTGFTPGAMVGGVPTDGTLIYSYELKTAQNQPGAIDSSDPIALTVTDAGAGTSNGTLTVRIVDDVPVATNDAAEITEDQASNTVSGNVVANGGPQDVADSLGADGAAAGGAVTGVSFGGAPRTVGTVFNTAFGQLTLNADGSYSYVLDNGNAAVNALKAGETLQEAVTYAITDGDGDASAATLTITIRGTTDGDPAIVPADGNGGATGEAEVHEHGLTDPSDGSQTTTGSIAVTAADGLQSITVGGTTVTLAELNRLSTTPVVIDTSEGTLTLIGFTPGTMVGGVPTDGTLTYSYELKTAQNQPGTIDSSDPIALTVTDAGGGTSNGTLTVRIIDDAPTATNDVAAVTEDTTSVTGNVVASGGPQDVADSLGADGAAIGGAVTGVSFDGDTQAVGTGFDMAYGQLTLNADGSYSYVLDNSNAAVNALKEGDSLQEVVSYTITDSDGETSTATLTITIQGRTDGPPTVAPVDGNGGATGEAEVHEHGLTDPSDTTETTTGSIAITAADGLESITVGGTTVTLAELNRLSTTPVVIDTGEGTLTLTGFTPGTMVGGVPTDGTLIYSYELKTAQNQPGATDSIDPIALTVTDAGGGTSAGTLTVRIIDDAPMATNDVAAVTEDTTSVTGNVVDNDSPGADGLAISPVTGVHFGTTDQTVGSGFDMAYGQLTLNADGSYSYVLDNSNAAVNALKEGDSLQEIVSYTITDSDGETSTATLTITIRGTTDGGPAIVPVDGNGGATGEAEVHEPGLTDPSDTRETTTGTIAITAADGVASITVGGTTVTLAELNGLSTTPVVIDTGEGRLTLTGFTPGTMVGDVPTDGTLTYSYELKTAQNQPGAIDSSDPIALTVTDAGGGTSNGTLTVRIVDDVPVATNDAVEITEDQVSTVNGNVVAGGGPQDVADSLGADGAVAGGAVTGVSFGGTVQAVGTVFDTAYGHLTLNADGSYTYELDNGNAAVNALKAGETLQEAVTYTITDGDGDTSAATLTITIRGTTDGGPAIVPVDGNGGATGEAEVHEHGLTDPSDGSQTTTGSIAITVPDGLTSITVDGTTVTLAELNGLSTTPVVIDTGEGMLTLTGFTPGAIVGGVPIEGTLTYSYVLKTAQDQPNATDSSDPITLTVTDAGGGTSNGTLAVRIIDDVPVATNDNAEIDEGTATVTGNVVASGGQGDVPDDLGADGAAAGGAVTGVSFGGTAHQVGTVFDTAYGHLTLNADGSYSYALNSGNPTVDALKAGDTLKEVVTYTITDADGETSTATLTLTIRGTNDTPTVVTGGELIDRSNIDAELIGPVDVTGGFTDVDIGDKLSYAAAGLPPGLVLDPQTGIVTGILDRSASQGGPNQDGVYVVTVTATDAQGASVAQTFRWVVSNPPPVAENDANVTDANSTVGGNLIIGAGPGLGRDSDPDRDTLTVKALDGEPVSSDGTSVRGSHGGTFTIRPDGTYIFDPGSDFQSLGLGETATTAVTYTIVDVDGATATATLTITVNGQSGSNVAAFMNLPGYDRWGLMSQWSKWADQDVSIDTVEDLEGEHVYRYTQVTEGITQRLLFRYSGQVSLGDLDYEAGLGRNQQLPWWISFDRSTQVVTAIPDESVEPGIYEVRVVARDAARHEAESILTIQVGRDEAKVLEEIKSRAEGGPGILRHLSPPPSGDSQPPATEQPTGNGQAKPAQETERSHVEQPASAATGKSTEAKDRVQTDQGGGQNASLSKTLHGSGATGRMIEAARFLEALAVDDQPRH
ncbi:VCBS domain-containing protein [Chelatococcus sp. GCM10030263]|uniref:VCBS domain-containing protein n=1 Tax=Chelatococcus sp. GCM10030263 TaxID=3273387 RepID=UPI003610A7C6